MVAHLIIFETTLNYHSIASTGKYWDQDKIAQCLFTTLPLLAVQISVDTIDGKLRALECSLKGTSD